MKRLVSILIGCAISLAAMAQTAPGGVQLLNNPGDGSLTVRSTASGRTRSIAMQNAQKQAVRAIIFTGVNVPGSVSLSKPLITDMNGQTKYEEFFNAFFADNGYYKSFVSLQDKKGGSSVRRDSKTQVTLQATVRVFRADLKKYLIENNVIPKQ